MDKPDVQVIVVGAGPAGLAAAIMAGAEGLETVLLEGGRIGGQAFRSTSIENYLGFPDGLTGAELARSCIRQAKKFGVRRYEAFAQAMERRAEHCVLELDDGEEISTESIVLANGVQWATLSVDGANELADKGVYFGPSVAGAKRLCAGRTVYILGAGNSAGQAAMFLEKFAEEVLILARSPLSKNMSKYLVDRIEASSRIRVEYIDALVRCEGDGCLEQLIVKRNGEDETLNAELLFTFIGAEPKTFWLPSEIKDKAGFIVTGTDYQTALPGIFAVGDVRAGSLKRVAVAAGEGAAAIHYLYQYLL